jgi:hypothetical protein
MKTDSTVICFCCDKQMNNWEYENTHRNGGVSYVRVHPMGGLHFETRGHYGSRVFDPMDGKDTRIDIAICDECLIAGVNKVYGTGVSNVQEIALYENAEYRAEMQKKRVSFVEIVDIAMKDMPDD